MAVAGNVVDTLEERGFIAQATEIEALKRHLESPGACYIGFDPTADSLHVGSLLPIMALVHMQRHGHRPIVLVGGGTGMVGDPSGKTEMRKMLTAEAVGANAGSLKTQLSRFLDFGPGKAVMLNNADWLLELRYIDFLRDVGRYFSVNKMLAAECYKMRLEAGLNFIEFNYMLLQAYDFYYLATHHNCLLQMGGNDQWGNIVAGTELIRRKTGRSAFAITFPLLTTASGAKMGKSESGAVWLSADKTGPFDFYQYWIDIDDRDVERFLRLYTLLPLDEIRVVEKLEGQELNACKTILAYEVTSLTHGRESAREAHRAAGAAFGRRVLPPELLPSSSVPRGEDVELDAVPTLFVENERLAAGVPAFKLFFESGLCASASAARRLIQQGGAYVNDLRIQEVDLLIGNDYRTPEGILLKAGKKKICKVRAEK